MSNCNFCKTDSAGNHHALCRMKNSELSYEDLQVEIQRLETELAHVREDYELCRKLLLEQAAAKEQAESALTQERERVKKLEDELMELMVQQIVELPDEHTESKLKDNPTNG